jgi:hypothetical protein
VLLLSGVLRCAVLCCAVVCCVLQDFGEHGREFITSEVGLKFLQVLGDTQQLSQLVGGGRRAARMQTILQHCVFKVCRPGLQAWQAVLWG